MRKRTGSEFGVPEAEQRRGVSLFRALVALCALVAAGSALAQGQPPPSPSPFPPGFVPPTQERPQPAPPTGTFDYSIETPRRSTVPRSVDELRFELKDVVVVGA